MPVGMRKLDKCRQLVRLLSHMPSSYKHSREIMSAWIRAPTHVQRMLTGSIAVRERHTSAPVVPDGRANVFYGFREAVGDGISAFVGQLPEIVGRGRRAHTRRKKNMSHEHHEIENVAWLVFVRYNAEATVLLNYCIFTSFGATKNAEQ